MSIGSQAMVRRAQIAEERQPSHLAFAKINGGWFKIGACWKTDFRNGGEGYSVQFSTLPINWDGRFILAVPDREPEPGDEAPQPEAQPPSRRRRVEPDPTI